MMKILLKVSGSIAAFKAAALASKLVQNGFEVQTVMTESAKDFIGAGTFEGLTGKRVATDLFEDGHRMEHIWLARWAELTLFYPASADSIAKLAQGRASDLASTLFLAHDFKSPYWISPAMNPTMFSHPAVQANLLKLKEYGAVVLTPDRGRMACGEYGDGRLIEPEALLSQLLEYKNLRRSQGRVLVTAGGTFDPIDSVRGITNTSTGETGVKLAETLSERGFAVTLLLSKTATVTLPKLDGIEVHRFTTYQDLDRALKHELETHDFLACVHAAAVGDFDAELASESGKISSREAVTLTLKPRGKILSRLKEYSKNKALKLISFKLTVGEWDEARLHSEYSMSDLVIQNDLSRIQKGGAQHEAQIYLRSSQGFTLLNQPKTKVDIFETVVKVLSEAAAAEV
ncbi:MAG: bifunctional phosphopantothenoylcysteine decarboxylase/phosphopantothenate--cysteine ligase CoaBC [Proteobacteria bacterium]|nr:MAG: bifunctional phosphopantothenoylcysteine decarboxylase/phosphopantothenate--cysteine ligase CoaBC [Pseudomonadota bacterium]